jgi:1,4-dihydroxy-2-naphthoate octaprenyltransferase
MPDQDEKNEADGADGADERAKSLEQARLIQETKNERHMWVFLAYFLFGIHVIAFVMIYAVRHAK